MSRRGGIDYSKWDKMDFSDDDEEEEDEDHQQGSSSYYDDGNDDDNSITKPRVTRLDEPSSVTFGHDREGSINIRPQQQQQQQQQQSNTKPQSDKAILETSSVQCSHRTSSNSGNNSTQETKKSVMNEEDEKVSPETIQSTKWKLLTRNGGTYIDPLTQRQTFWSQDRHEVIFYIPFDGTQIPSRTIRVQVKGAFHYKDRFSAVGGNRPLDADGNNTHGSKGELLVTTTATTTASSSSSTERIILFKGSFAYSIYLPEDEDEVDWEIDATTEKNPNHSKLIKITLLKALPMQGLTIWWNKPFLGYPEIDVVKDIQDRDGKKTRNKDGNMNDNTTSAKNHEEMKAVWDEAHRMFREKVKNRQKQSIDIN